MATVTQTTIVPQVSAETAGPLGAMHLPRFWLKMRLVDAGMLPGDYFAGDDSKFDVVTLDDLGLDREKTYAYLRERKPTYVEFERWVREHGKTDAETIAHHNAAIMGIMKAPDKEAAFRARVGLTDADPPFNSAMLNLLDDLHTVHETVAAKA
jgi:hypothetical protein